MAYTLADLAAINSAIARGEKSVRFTGADGSGRTVEFRSTDELLKAKADILRELNAPASPGAGRSRSIRIRHGGKGVW